MALFEDRADTYDKPMDSEMEGHPTNNILWSAQKDEHISFSTPKEKNSLLGLQTKVGLDGNQWQVYSRKKRSQKQSNTGLLPSNPSCSTIFGNKQQHQNNISIQPEETHQDILQQQSTMEAAGAIPISDTQHDHEANLVLDVAKQLGLTGEGSKEEILEKFQHMEERDRADATRRANNSRNQ